MKRNELTAYDKFLMSKSNMGHEETMSSSNNFQTNKYSNNVLSSDYAQYLENQLRRTKPSDEKVLTEYEFNQKNNSVHSNNIRSNNYNVKSDIASTNKSSEATATATPKRGLNNVKFKKTGKILLVAYVIIMICLALIVIVKTTTAGEIKVADASDAEIEKSNQIETMSGEEKENNNSWFDGFCDSLK